MFLQPFLFQSLLEQSQCLVPATAMEQTPPAKKRPAPFDTPPRLEPKRRRVDQECQRLQESLRLTLLNFLDFAEAMAREALAGLAEEPRDETNPDDAETVVLEPEAESSSD